MANRGSVPAVATTFAVAGVLVAAGYARMPTLRDQVGASTSQLGLALVGSGLGSVVAMPWTGRFVERWGSRRTVLAAAAVACAGWAAIAFVDTPLQLGLVMLVLGAGVGVWDVAMNVQGHEVERIRHRSLMPRLHAAYSAGMLLGALVGVLMARVAMPLPVQLPVTSVAVFLTLAVVGRRFVPDAAAVRSTAAPAVGAPDRPSAPVRGITGLELVIGVICLATSIGEGAAGDWLALLLVDERAAPEAVGALTFAAFNLTMLTGRLVGGPAIERFGRVTVLRVSGCCAVVGLLLICLVPNLGAALAGGLLWGLGLATVFPATISAAGEVPGRGQRAIGVVSTIGYGGFLLGAPIIGLLATYLGLDGALLVVAAISSLIVLLAPAVAPRPDTSHTLTEPDSTFLR